MATYTRDPRWITSKFAGIDANGRQFKKGDRIFFYPIGKRILTGEAAEQASREFDAARQDEEAFQ